MKPSGWIGVAAAGVIAGLFAFLNRFERVSVDLALTRIDALPLSTFFFAAFLMGMAAMLLLSLPSDRRARELLRAHGLLDAPAPGDLPGSLTAPLDASSTTTAAEGHHPS